MKYRIQLLQGVNEQIAEAFEWYQVQSEFAAAYFFERLEESLEIISGKPLIYQKVHKEFRQILLTPFLYVLIYKIVGEEIRIYRQWHTSRNPKRKFK